MGNQGLPENRTAENTACQVAESEDSTSDEASPEAAAERHTNAVSNIADTCGLNLEALRVPSTEPLEQYGAGIIPVENTEPSHGPAEPSGDINLVSFSFISVPV